MTHSASAMVEVLGSIDDAEARAEASRLAVENFREKKLPGRWEVALASLPTPEARRALLAALTDRDDTARWTAAQAILEHWEEVPAEALPALRRVLKNRREHDEIRFCAAGALARRDDAESRKEYVPRLLKAIRELNGADADEFPPPTRAATLLCGVSDAAARREAVEFLRERLPNGSEPILALALPALLGQGAEWFVAALVNACRDRHPRSPSAATLARAFGDLRSRQMRSEAWERLREAIGERPSSAVQPHCLTLLAALGHLRCPDALPYLRSLRGESEDAPVREAARESLARQGDRDAVRSFAGDLTADRSEESSRAERLRLGQRAAEILADVRDPDVRPIAIHALTQALREPALAREAARALRQLGSPVPESSEPEDAQQANEAGQAISLPTGASRQAGQPAPLQANSLPHPRPPSPITRRGIEPPEIDETEAQREHRLVVMLEDVQHQVAALPHRYFTYAAMSGAERAEKERALRHMILGSIRVLMDTTQSVVAAGIMPASGPTIALAYYLQGRVHHALACDAVGRDASSRDATYHHRLENLNRAEESYRYAIESTEVAAYRARAYFDLAVLLAESDRRSEAMTAFEAVTDLDLTGSLGQAAEENLKRLKSGPVGDGRQRRARFSLPRLLARGTMAAAVGTLLWVAYVQAFEPNAGQGGLWRLVGDRYWPFHRANAAASAPRTLGEVVVATDRLRVHTDPGKRYPVVHTARRGQRLTIIGQTDTWWKVVYPNGVTGWAARRLTGPLSGAEEVNR